jgi:hypothetical protein
VVSVHSQAGDRDAEASLVMDEREFRKESESLRKKEQSRKMTSQ